MTTSEYTTIANINGYDILISVEDVDLFLESWILLGNKYVRQSIYNPVNRTIKDRLLHRVILERILNRPMLQTEFVDHINSNGLDNRRENLRLATKSENNWNAKLRKDSPSGYKGVTLDKGKWRARISVHKRQIFLGYFDTPEEAHVAYCKAADEYHGAFARYQ